MPTQDMAILLFVEAAYQDWLMHLKERTPKLLALSVLVLSPRGMRALFLEELGKAIDTMLFEQEVLSN